MYESLERHTIIKVTKLYVPCTYLQREQRDLKIALLVVLVKQQENLGLRGAGVWSVLLVENKKKLLLML